MLLRTPRPVPYLGILVSAVFICHSAVAHAQPVVRLPAADQPLRRDPRTLFTVGVADGGPQAFGNVTDVAFDDAENLYVLDVLSFRVVVFDSAGRLIRTMGQRGEGPGELSTPQQMAVTGGGEGVVSDVGRRALVIFRRDGSFARNVPFAGATLPFGRRLLPHPRGGVVRLAMGNPGHAGAGAFGEEVLLWMPVGPEAPRALLSISTPEARGADRRPVTVHAPRIFAPGFHFAVLPDGSIAYAESASWSIRVLGSGGRITRVLERGIRPRPVTARDRAAEVERQERRQSGMSIDGARMPDAVRQGLADQLRNAEFAPVIPVISGLIADPSGNLWVARSGPAPDQPRRDRRGDAGGPLPRHHPGNAASRRLQPRRPRGGGGNGRTRRAARGGDAAVSPCRRIRSQQLKSDHLHLRGRDEPIQLDPDRGGGDGGEHAGRHLQPCPCDGAARRSAGGGLVRHPAGVYSIGIPAASSSGR
jgi:6-bladed beta-propeller